MMYYYTDASVFKIINGARVTGQNALYNISMLYIGEGATLTVSLIIILFYLYHKSI